VPWPPTGSCRGTPGGPASARLRPACPVRCHVQPVAAGPAAAVAPGRVAGKINENVPAGWRRAAAHPLALAGDHEFGEPQLAFVTLAAWAAFRERPDRKFLIFLPVVTAGVVLTPVAAADRG